MKEKTKQIIIDKMNEAGFMTDDIIELAAWINNYVPGVEVAINMPYDAAELHNLIVLDEPA